MYGSVYRCAVYYLLQKYNYLGATLKSTTITVHISFQHTLHTFFYQNIDHLQWTDLLNIQNEIHYIFKLNVLLTVHHNTSVELNQRDALSNQFIKN
jgi:hypothetical protein